LQRAIDCSEHVMSSRLKFAKGLPLRVQCARCQQTCPRATIKKILKGNCTPTVPAVRGNDISIADARATYPVTVGRVDLDRSHPLAFKKGLWWCTSCGFYTSAGMGKTSPKNLRKKCSKKPTGAGLDYLRRLAKGLPPKANMG